MTRFPSIFVGHGSPMNAITNSNSAKWWKELAKTIPLPRAILAVSAHWYIPETAVTAQEWPETIHDFKNHPQELFDVQYPCPGSPELAHRVLELVPGVKLDNKSWGIDHGIWSILIHMYPNADVPVIQISLDSRQPAQFHYELGQRLAPLRDEDVLILGSGNIVHNFAYLDFNPTAAPKPWALEFEKWVKDITQNDEIDRSDAFAYPLIHWEEHPYGGNAQNSPDHFLPVLTVLGTANQTEPIRWPYQAWEIGSFSMSIFGVGLPPIDTAGAVASIGSSA